MSAYVNDLALLVVLLYLGLGFVISGSILGLAYLAYRKFRRLHGYQGRRRRR